MADALALAAEMAHWLAAPGALPPQFTEAKKGGGAESKMKFPGKTPSGLAVLAGGLLFVCLSSTPLRAISIEEVVVGDFLQTEQQKVPQGWELSVHEGEPDLTLVPDGGGQALKLRSRLSSFSLTRAVDIDLKKTPYLEWQWKVTELPTGGDFRRPVTDDQAAQLIVVFSWGGLRQEVIMYMWDSTAPEGIASKVPSPPLYPFLDLHAVVVRSGETQAGKWITERRDVVADYRRLFGREPEKIRGIRIQINSQHTKSQAEAYWRSVKFKASAESVATKPPASRPVRWDSPRMTAGALRDRVGSENGAGRSSVGAEGRRDVGEGTVEERMVSP